MKIENKKEWVVVVIVYMIIFVASVGILSSSDIDNYKTTSKYKTADNYEVINNSNSTSNETVSYVSNETVSYVSNETTDYTMIISISNTSVDEIIDKDVNISISTENNTVNDTNVSISTENNTNISISTENKTNVSNDMISDINDKMNQTSSEMLNWIVYNVSVDIMNPYVHKYWGYVESKWYGVMLYDGDSLHIDLNIKSDRDIDVTEIRLYHVCNIGDRVDAGRLYNIVNGRYSLPTIGVQNNKIPVYAALPPCNEYGTVVTFVWDTDDTRGNGLFHYDIIYNGRRPMKIKTVELYIVKKLL